MLDERPRLTYLISSLEVGGAERGMSRLLTGLVDDYDITVVSLRGGQKGILAELPDAIRTLDLNIQSVRNTVQLRHLCSELVKTDILVCSLYHAAVIGTTIGRTARVSTILTWQHNESFSTRFRKQLFGVAARLSDRVLADSKTVARMIEQTYGSAVSVAIVPIAGVETDQFAPSKTDCGINSTETTVGILGSLTNQKNHDAVLTAADRLQDEQIRFEIAGKGPRQTELREIVTDRELKNVQFRGFVDDAPSFLNNLDIYVQPSNYEGLCITAIEAMSCGLPVVATDVGGLSESVVDNETGYLVEPGNLDAFVDRICDLHASPKRRDRMGRRARQRVIDQYSRTTLVDEFTTVLTTARANTTVNRYGRRGIEQ